MRIARTAIFLAALSVSSVGKAWAAGPAFDCSKASGSVEELICGNAELAALDQKLDATYKAATKVIEGFGGQAARKNELRNLKVFQRGWIKGRNECWKASDIAQCTRDEYQRRIAELQAQYVLVKGGKPVFFTCDGSPADEIVATFIPAELPAVRLERGDRTIIAIASSSASGAKYEGPFGMVFWTKGDQATVEWPQGNEFKCVIRE
jgi:uncharacterized protein